MLRPKKHITRQKIKEDKFVTETLKTAEWIKDHQSRLTAGAIVLLIAGVVIWGYMSARQAAEDEASLLTLQGGYALDFGDLDQARFLLVEAAERYGSVPSARRATLMLGHLFFRLGAIDSSRAYYELYLDKYSKRGMLRASSMAGVAACMEEVGSHFEAAEMYEKAAKENRGGQKSAHYLLQAGRAYRMAGQTQQAMTVYERLKLEYPFEAEADRAALELAQLARQGG